MNTLLLSVAVKGVFYVVFLFAVCFFGVHLARLVGFGWENKNRSTPQKPEPPPEKKTPETTSREQVYYIVERKRRKPKTSYGEPKEIRFK